MNDNPIVEDLFQVNIFLYNTDTVDGAKTGEPVKRSVGKISKTVRLLPYNSHNCFVFKIIAFFKSCCCPSCDHFNIESGNVEMQLISSKEPDKHVFPRLL